jgi:flagellar biosynthesis chaperone FliJ
MDKYENQKSSNIHTGLGKVSDTLNHKEGEITREIAYIEKSMTVLQEAIDTLTYKTSKACRQEEEITGVGGTEIGYSSDLARTLQQINQAIQHQTNRIFSINDRVEL